MVDVNVRDLRYFVAVAEELHFTRAAERLHVSQPALSRQIARLESELRTTLLDRTRRSVAVTEAGAALLDAAPDVLDAWHRAELAVAAATATARSVLRVGMHTGIGRGILARVRAQLEESHPQWQLALRRSSWADPSCGLADGSVDIAISWLPTPDPPAYRWRVLATEPRHVALPRGHRLAVADAVGIEDLAAEPFVALPAGAGTLRDHWLARDERAHEPVIGAEADDVDEAFELIEAGAGVALLSAGNADLYHRPGIATVPVHDIRPSELAIVWRADDRRQIVRRVTALDR